MIRLKTLLLSEAVQKKPIAQRIKGGILNAVRRVTGKPIEVEIPIDKAQAKYKFAEQDLVTAVTGTQYMYMANTQTSTQDAITSDAFISIASLSDTMPSNPAFKRVAYSIVLDVNINTYQYFLMNYYTDGAVTDTIGEMQQGYNTISSVNTFEGKSGTIEFPQEASNLIRTGFPKNYMEIQRVIKHITGVSITFSSDDDSNKERIDFR
jgi:hypothetical protein